MSKVHMKRLFAFCLTLLMVFSLSICFVGAAEEEYTPIEWVMAEDATYLYGDEKYYDRYFVNGAFYSDAKCRFNFMNRVEFDGTMCPVYGDSIDPHIVCVQKNDGYSFVFVDEEGKGILDRFLQGEDCIYYLEDNQNRYAPLDEQFVRLLDSSFYASDAPLTEKKVGELSEGAIYELTAHDSTGLKAYQHGAVYVLPDGNTYYLCFDELDNSYFDADGYFSYRKGSVSLLKLEGSLLTDVEKAIPEMEYKTKEYLYESDYVNIPGDEGYAPEGDPLSFFIFAIPMGFVLPLAILVTGIVLAKSKKLGENKAWYWLSATGALWILAAAGIMAIVLS